MIIVNHADSLRLRKTGGHGGILNVAVSSNVGKHRPNNEDNFIIGEMWNSFSSDIVSDTIQKEIPFPEWLCIGVFDGMGGGENGELASAFAAREFQKVFASVPVSVQTEELDEIVKTAIRSANRKIVEGNEISSILGTTATVICTDGKRFKVYHIGDSRAYLLRDNRLFQLTTDQTLATLKIQAGYYNEDDAEAEADRHKLTEYVGKDPTSAGIAPLESQWLELQPQDKLLLCSDGLYDLCPNAKIFALLNTDRSLREIADDLVNTALENGGLDNITCMIAGVQTASGG